MDMTASIRRLSFSLSALTGVVLLAGCAATYNNKVGITPQPVVILWNTTGPAQQFATMASVDIDGNPIQVPNPLVQPPPVSPIGSILSTTPLSTNELNIVTSTPGTAVYSPAEGTFLSPGTQTLSVTVTPTDPTRYSTTTRTVQIQVNDPASAAGQASLVPEAVQIIGGGFVDGIFFHPLQKDLRYVRTDVGGAYRWNPKPFVATTAQPKPPVGTNDEPLQYGVWTPLLDFVGRANGGDQGVEAIGLDPSDPKRLYLATGLNYNNDPTQQNHFYLSDDQGNTFTQVNAPFPINGNDNGRDGGERFAVDPNLGTTIYYGSRTAGLWQSLDRGVTWNQVTSFPVTGKTAGAGVAWVSFVPGSGTSGAATPVIYAGVSDYNYYNSDGSNNGSPKYSPVYRSVDAGATWQAVPGQPTTIANPGGGSTPANYNLSPIHGIVGGDGVNGSTGSLYVTYFSDQGPGDTYPGAGAVYQYTPTVGDAGGPGTWTDISPSSVRGGNDDGGYGGITLDAEIPGVIMVSTMDDYNNGDAIYRSLNYGRTWRILDEGTTAGTSINDTAGSVWLGFAKTPTSSVGTGNWLAALAIDPFDSTHAEFGSGQTLWDTSGPTTGLLQADIGKQTIFSVGAYGAAAGGVKQVPGGQSIEETVVLGLKSLPSGAPLFSAVGDLGNFVHVTLDQSPVLGATLAPQFTTSTGLDFVQSNPQTLVRVGNGCTSNCNDTANAPYYPDPTASPQPTSCVTQHTGCLQVQIPQYLAYTITQGVKGNDWTGVDTLYDAPNLKSVTPTTKLSSGGGTVAISSDGATLVWAPSDFPPACSPNNGITWTPAVNGIVGAQVVSDRITPGKFYMYDSTSGKLLMGVAAVNTSAGSSVFQCNLTFNTMSTLPAYSYGQLTPSFGADGDVWLAINGSSSAGANGLYHSTDSGKTLTKASVFTAAYAVGLGAPATSSAIATYSKPAIYTAADGASGYGFYRSIDNGATWVQFSNPSHLLGTVNQIIGDPRTFGRYYIGTSGRGIAYVDSQ